VAISNAAVDEIPAETECYPFFLQVWGHHVWETAETSPVSVEDVRVAAQQARQYLDSGFFNVRYQRLSERQRDYAFALARLGGGPATSKHLAEELAIAVEQAAAMRAGLIAKGLAYSPSRGLVAFTVPKFDEYLRRIESSLE